MKSEDKEQIKNLIINFSDNNEYIPYLSQLKKHKIYWPIFSQFSEKEDLEVEKIIQEIILEKIENLKTKGGQLFQRFVEMDTERFWNFRKLNENEETSNKTEFQTIWKEIENEIFKLEWILTQAMINRSEWVGKTIDSFYKIVYSFFPNFNKIQ